MSEETTSDIHLQLYGPALLSAASGRRSCWTVWVTSSASVGNATSTSKSLHSSPDWALCNDSALYSAYKVYVLRCVY